MTNLFTNPDDLIDMISGIISEKKKLDPVDKKENQKDFKDREDKDIDNDGDADDSDKYLHKKRKAITKKSKNDVIEINPKDSDEKQDLFPEEVELDELSKYTLKRYVKKATRDAGDQGHDIRTKEGGEQSKAHRKLTKRLVGVNTAVDKLTKEEAITEAATVRKGDKVVHDDTGKYGTVTNVSGDGHAFDTTWHDGDRASHTKELIRHSTKIGNNMHHYVSSKKSETSDGVARSADKRRLGKKLKEDINEMKGSRPQDNQTGEKSLVLQGSSKIKDKGQDDDMANKMPDMTEQQERNIISLDEKISILENQMEFTPSSYQPQVQMRINQLQELKKSTLANYAASSAYDYKQRANRVKSNDEFSDAASKSGLNNKNLNKMKAATDSDNKKHKFKMQKRAKGLETAGKKLAKEEVELDELSKKTLGSYINKASDDKAKKHHSSRELSRRADRVSSDGSSADHGNDQDTMVAAQDAADGLSKRSNALNNKAKNRSKGISRAVNRLTKEDFNLENLDYLEENELAHIESIEQRIAIVEQQMAHTSVTHAPIYEMKINQLQELSKKTLGSYLKAMG